MGKRVFGVSNQVRLKLACSSTDLVVLKFWILQEEIILICSRNTPEAWAASNTKRKEDNDQESIQLPNTFRPTHQRERRYT